MTKKFKSRHLLSSVVRILFVCVGNSCRSQMAEGLALKLGFDAASAGTNPANDIALHAITAMNELGIDISSQRPKSVDDFDAVDFDKVISMGCGVSCPEMRIDTDWGLTDPYNGSLEEYRATRDEIHKLIQHIKE